MDGRQTKSVGGKARHENLVDVVVVKAAPAERAAVVPGGSAACKHSVPI